MFHIPTYRFFVTFFISRVFATRSVVLPSTDVVFSNKTSRYLAFLEGSIYCVALRYYSVPLNVSRTNLPATYTSVVRHHGSFVPDDTITYRFSDALMALDDVALALAESYFEATQLLSYAYGNENQPVRRQSLRIKGDFYDFDVGSDLYAEENSFKLWHLRAWYETS